MRSKKSRRGKPKDEVVEIDDGVMAQVYLAQWQRLLRLEDWDIKLKMARRTEVASGALASVSIRLQENAADITIAQLADVGDTWETDKDLELTVVHELMHVRSHAALEVGSELEKERFVEGMARVLLKLVRRPK